MRSQKMGGEELDSAKSQLVREICTISSLFTSCSHLRSNARKPGFVDWYLVLRIDEDSSADVIRRRYRQLALQLHPDKNRHPKAEVAFKLISEAYECLSDKTKRKAFNSERRRSFCKECHRKLLHSSAQKSQNIAPAQAKPCRGVLQALKEAQNRLKEECRVIENCLRVSEAAGNGNESPLFDPTNRLHFPDYPHRRGRAIGRQQQDDYWHFGDFSNQWSDQRVRCESPVYQLRPESRPSWTWNHGFRF